MRRYVVSMIILTNALCAFAQQQGAKSPGSAFGGGFLPMMLVMVAIMYFLMIRPQQKKQKETQSMLGNLKKGDKVRTIAGIIGVVGNVKDTTVMVKVADDTVLEFEKAAISAVLGDTKDEKSIEGQKGK